jgi:peroxiredoxin
LGTNGQIPFSNAGVRSSRVQVGELAPDFVLQGSDGTPKSLAALIGRPVLILFYRGHW